MALDILKINNWFKTALTSEIDSLRKEIALTPRQDKVFEMFYLLKKPIDYIADECNVCIMVINMELKLIRQKILRVLP